AAATPDVLFSVVMPTYQRASTLRHVLDVWAQQQPADLPFEIVAVDDGSRDATPAVLRAARPTRYRLRVVRQPNGGPARARNRALGLARGRYVLFTGDDIEPTPDLLARHAETHRAHGDPDLAVLGLTRWATPDRSAAGRAPTRTMRHIDGAGSQQFSYRFFDDGASYDFRHFYTSNVSVDRDLLLRAPDGFSTDYPAAAFEDAEFAFRLTQHGMRIVYRADAVGLHHHPYDAAGFCRRQMRCGAMAAVLYRQRPVLGRFLDLARLRRARMRLLAQPQPTVVGEVLAALETWETRAERWAASFDPPHHPAADDPVDDLLRALFRLAYLRGLASALYRPDTARRLRARLLLDFMPAAIGSCADRLDLLHHPYPMADAERFRDLRRRRMAQDDEDDDVAD
ncbi:MAG: glycosyltransferase family A protein, partial [Acidobacteriota bacterium]